MIEKLQINLPEIRFTGTTASALVAKQAAVYDLWNLTSMAGYAPLPDVLKVIEFWIWRQEPLGEIPAGYYGDVPFVVDPGGAFCKWARYPAFEDGHPATLKFLGAAFMRPGELRLPPRTYHKTPVIIRKGDKLIVPVECANVGGVQFSFFGHLVVESETGDFPMESNLAYLKPVSAGQAGTAAVSGRIAIPPIPVGGPEVRFGFGAREFGGSIAKASFGVQSGTGPDMVAAGLPITFNAGAAGFNVPVMQRIWSDWRPATATVGAALAAGTPLLVNMTFNGPWASSVVPGGSWWSPADTHATAAMASASYQFGLGYFVDAVQFR